MMFLTIRTLGLRHLVVVNHSNVVLGIITRQDLAHPEETIRKNRANDRLRALRTPPSDSPTHSARLFRSGPILDYGRKRLSVQTDNDDDNDDSDDPQINGGIHEMREAGEGTALLLDFDDTPLDEEVRGRKGFHLRGEESDSL